MPPDLVEEILRWPAAIQACHLDALTSHLAGRLNRRLSQQEVDTALHWLAARGLVERLGDQVWLSEPERPELELYQGLGQQLVSSALLKALGVQSCKYVFQKTASGGTLGDGPLTRPDFTLAAIRSWRFDPGRTLEVFSFEVKNRGGATVASVYEVVAHGRLVHHPYLVCPRSRLEPDRGAAIRGACVGEGVGLIQFDIVENGVGGFSIDKLAVEVTAERRSPDPIQIEKHLEKRFTSDNCIALQELAKGA